MAETNVPTGSTPDNPDILCQMSRLTELRLQVQEDAALGVVVVDIAGMPEGASLILATNHALDLALRLTGACARLQRARHGEDLGPPHLGPGSLGSRF